MVVVVVEGKKAADSASDQRKDAALGIGQWQEVRKERERNVNEREKLSYFVWKAVLYSRERGWSYRFETKKWFQRGRNIFWRVSFFFFTEFSPSEKGDSCSVWLKFAFNIDYSWCNRKKFWKEITVFTFTWMENIWYCEFNFFFFSPKRDLFA